MRLAGMLAKHSNADPTQGQAKDMLQMATLDGARALGLEQDIGSLEVGKSADLIAIIPS